MSSAERHAPGFLQTPLPEVLLFGGKGGVGKTSCAVAAALTLSASHPEHTFLLVSTDPAHSLADSLADSPLPENLTHLEFDAHEALASFKAKHHEKLTLIASRGTFLDDDDIQHFLDLSLPGLDELMAFLQLSDWLAERRYRCIVMDTAPTGHTLRLLSMPALIRPWLLALDALLGKHRYMKKLFSGRYEQDEVDRFLLEFSASVSALEELLQDRQRALFVPVMLAEAFSVKETDRLLKALKKLHIPASAMVVNKLYPANSCPVCQQERNRQAQALDPFMARHKQQEVWGLPMSAHEVRGIQVLSEFWGGAERLSPGRAKAKRAQPAPTFPPVVPLRGLPLPEQSFLIFAGKGGVGKTTLACATALRLAMTRKVLLFSTDPAHSLQDCLDVGIGATPVRVCPGLDAMEIDGQAEFAALKSQYAADLEKLLDRQGATLDFTFDREVMDRVLDLSPPGLDEVMALLKSVDTLQTERYDVLVLDAAPTGHLLRLLEMPDLVSDWLRVFFELFIKYKEIFRLPRISARMVKMSKDLKHLKEIMQDAQRSALYAVTIPTDMAALETGDLVGSCRAMGMAVPVMFCNLVTPPSDCAFCTALHRQEEQVLKRLATALPNPERVLIHRQQEPRGLERLTALGEALYGQAV